MFVPLPQVLSREEVARCRRVMEGASWVDGKATAGYQSAKAKSNLQLAEDSAAAAELRPVVLAALERNPRFISAVLPRYVFPPLFNRYEVGMGFGTHVDNAIRQVGGGPHRIRTDVSATLFLSDPEDYDGGELVIENQLGLPSIKLGAGDLIIYPSTTLHRVAPVTRGTRYAAFFWIQSLVKDQQDRALLFELDDAIRVLTASLPDQPALIGLTACYHNLVRRWTEL